MNKGLKMMTSRSSSELEGGVGLVVVRCGLGGDLMVPYW